MKRISLLIVLTGIIVAAAGCENAPKLQAPKKPVTAIRVNADFEYDRGNWDAARAEYLAIVERYPGDWQAQYRLGQCNLALQNNAEARRALEIAHTLQPDNERVADALAEALFRTGAEDRLFTFLNERARITQSVHSYVRLARYAMDSGDPDTAKLAIHTAISLDDGHSVEPYLAASQFAELLGNVDLAVRRLRQAYGIDPQDERVRQRLIALGEIPGPTLALPPGQ